MAEHTFGDDKHTWIENMFVFPEDVAPGTYEYDVPYLVEYCACGARRTKEMTDEQIQKARISMGLPAEEVLP